VRTAAIVVAAGRGERLGANRPKALVSLCGRPLLRHVLERVAASGIFETVVVVGPAEHLEECWQVVPRGLPATVVAGGSRRQDSVRLGIEALDDRVEIVIVHDAARPLVSTDLFRRVREEAIRTGAAVPILGVADTVKVLDGSGRIVGDCDRQRLGLAQTPQAFRVAWRLGLPVAAVAGETWNLKITRPEDLELAESLLTRFVSGTPTSERNLDQT
jgi:2-C-methyl-D-erythritol 4-phosphate cytidylyltransferase